jgi:hypothetical protein
VALGEARVAMRLLSNLCVLLAALALAGCATAANHVKIARYGAVDVSADEDLADKAEAMPWHKDYPVVVMRGVLPQGVEISENGKISVDRAAAGEIQVLGTVESEANAGAILQSTAWYVDMHPSEGAARDWFCKVQLPLRLATLTLWSYLTPFGWVCLAAPRADERGFRLHLQELRRAAYAMGGNLVVLTGRTDLVSSRNGVEVGRVEGVKITGLVLKTPDPHALKIVEK